MYFILTRLYLLILACIWGCAKANTEIINIEAVETELSAHELLPPWEALSPYFPERKFILTSAPLGTPSKHVCRTRIFGPETPDTNHNAPVPDCPHEVWIVLDFDHPLWRDFTKFTLRVSWPANYPADFHIEAPPHLDGPPSSEWHQTVAQNTTKTNVAGGRRTRRHYARIRVVDTGVRALSSVHSSPLEVPFTLRVEPLYLGVLPASVLPVLGLLLPVVIVAGFLVMPRTHHYIVQIAEDVRAESIARQKEE